MRHAIRFDSVKALLTAVILIVVAVGGCSATGSQRTVGTVVDDTTITAQVKGRLAAAEAETLAKVDVDTVNGVVYLNGTVDDAQLKARAESIARSQEGVRRVVNNLRVASR